MDRQPGLPRPPLSAELLDALEVLRRDELPEQHRALIEQARWTADWVLELDSEVVLAPEPTPELVALLEQSLLPYLDRPASALPEFDALVAHLLAREGLEGAASWFRGRSEPR